MEEFDPAPYVEDLENMARYGKRSPHADGWGVWILGSHGLFYHKETSPIWERSIEKFPPARILFAHARKKGKKGARIAIENTHPFVSHGAVFMHNGSIDIEHGDACGETDSERLFMNILHRGLWNTLCEIDSYNFTAINFVLYKDGKVYAVRKVKSEKSRDYYTLYYRSASGRVIITTEGPGTLLENGTVLSVDEDTNFEVLPVCPGMFR